MKKPLNTYNHSHRAREKKLGIPVTKMYQNPQNLRSVSSDVLDLSALVQVIISTFRCTHDVRYAGLCNGS